MQTRAEIWEDVAERGRAGLSIGFIAHEMTDEDPPRIVDWELIEVSLVASPANAAAVINEVRQINSIVPAVGDRGQVVNLP